MNFTPLDWAIVGIYLLLSVAVGVLARKYVGSVADYLVAGRELGTYL
jgi:Na+/proline symporter